MFGNDDVLANRRDGWMDLARLPLKEALALDGIPDRGEKPVARTDLRKSGAEAHLHVDDCHAAIAGSPQHLRRSLGETLLVSRVECKNAGLHIHTEYCGTGRVQRNIDGHFASPLFRLFVE
jgi:hypothetical protein